MADQKQGQGGGRGVRGHAADRDKKRQVEEPRSRPRGLNRDKAAAATSHIARAGRGNAPDAGSATSDEQQATLAGLAARQLAANLIDGVLRRRQTLDDLLAQGPIARHFETLSVRDRGFTRLLTASVLRRHGSLAAVLARFIERPLPEEARPAQTVLLLGAAQILLLATPAHAAINLAVEQIQRDRTNARYAKLANAVLRRVAREGASLLAEVGGPIADTPPWLLARWRAAYGEALALSIAAASLVEAPLDLTLKEPQQVAEWARRLGGRALATGSVRIAEHGRIEDLPGFADGTWWVQDAAATLPIRLLGDVRDKAVGDLCAAPGGKTAALLVAGARVTAIDASAKRFNRLRANMRRLGWEAHELLETVVADVREWAPPVPLDAVLLDAPCTATGTIRRHPDLIHLKRPEDVARLADLQAALLAKASEAVALGGILVYCTCSMEPEEGVEQIAKFLAANPRFARQPVGPGDGIAQDAITPEGDLRTLPCHGPLAIDGTLVPGGMDGFYAARLVRTA